MHSLHEVENISQLQPNKYQALLRVTDAMWSPYICCIYIPLQVCRLFIIYTSGQKIPCLTAVNDISNMGTPPNWKILSLCL